MDLVLALDVIIELNAQKKIGEERSQSYLTIDVGRSRSCNNPEIDLRGLVRNGNKSTLVCVVRTYCSQNGFLFSREHNID